MGLLGFVVAGVIVILGIRYVLRKKRSAADRAPSQRSHSTVGEALNEMQRLAPRILGEGAPDLGPVAPSFAYEPDDANAISIDAPPRVTTDGK